MAESFKIHQLDGGGYFDMSKHPDTLRIEVYWKDRARWAMVADMGEFDLMLEEATRVFKQMVVQIADYAQSVHKDAPKLIATTLKQKKLWEKQYPGVKVYLSKKLPN